MLLALVLVHGVFWSGLLSASAAYMTEHAARAPPRRGDRLLGSVERWRDGGRADGRVLDLPARLAVAVHRIGAALNLPWRRSRGGCTRNGRSRRNGVNRAAASRGLLEWRVLVLSITLFLYSFGYGGITSFTALYADANGVTPKSIYLTTLAIVVLVTRPLSGRLGDRFGYRRVFLPCLVLISGGLVCLALGGTRGLDDRVGHIFGTGLRHGVSRLRRLRDARRRAGAPWRRLRRHPRRIRHRHRHRLDVDGLDHPALRLRIGVRRGMRRCPSSRRSWWSAVPWTFSSAVILDGST